MYELSGVELLSGLGDDITLAFNPGAPTYKEFNPEDFKDFKKPRLFDFNLDMPLAEIEKGHILRALAYNHGNKTKTAESLGITIKTLYNKLHKYGVSKPALTIDSHEDEHAETFIHS